MRFFILAIFLSVPSIFISEARADIYDRINDCQNGGGGDCVFDILRELASAPSNPNCRGASVEGACWFKGEVGQSCTQVCSRLNLLYDGRTSLAENNSVCQEVGTALGSRGNGQVNGQSSCGGTEQGTGCSFWPGGGASLFWCGGTTADAASTHTARMCACI